MKLRGIADATALEGKKVLVRVDFNIELDDIQNVEEHFKLDIAKQTIDYLVDQKVEKVVMASHFGRPDGKRDEKFSLRPVADDVERALGRRVHFVDDCIGSAVTEALAALPAGEVLLLENLRFYAEEDANDGGFSKQLAAPFDIFVNEAFSVCHRAHASVVGVTEHIPSYAGFRLIEEVAHLERLQSNPVRPAVAVIGGAKIETKLPIIRTFEKIYDAVLVGGKIANEAIEQNIVFEDNVMLPQDFQGENKLDIGPMTSAAFGQIIAMAKTIIWNGPMGKFEEKPYDLGTKIVLHAIMENKEASVVIGGGESLAVVEHENAIDRVGFVSTGGGAMLDFLGGVTMPGLDVLKAK
ncbi:MAG: phosphoglycerate kinase [Candidatus Moranbacteria bacterium]|nr:phosphoglycerate kinase [Candidatus Moranbacteria bacterium]